MRRLKLYFMLGIFGFSFFCAMPERAGAGEANFYCLTKDLQNQTTYYSAVFSYTPQGMWDHSLVDELERKFLASLKWEYSLSSYSSTNCYLKNDYYSAKEERDDEIANDYNKVVKTGWKP